MKIDYDFYKVEFKIENVIGGVTGNLLEIYIALGLFNFHDMP